MFRSFAAAALCLGLLAPLPALAGSGPWVVGDGEYSLFMGVEAQRLDRLDVRDGAGGKEVIDVDQGLSSVGAKAILTLGARGRFETELTLPVQRVQANRTDGPICQSLGMEACETTQGVGVIGLRGKGTVLDELYGAPLTLALGGAVRLGHFTAPTRARITNLGEGTLDLGGFVSAGRGGSLGSSGYWSGWLEASAFYRMPNTRDYPGPDGVLAVPRPEGTIASEVLFGFTPAFSFGPSVSVFGRPGGVDFGELDLTDPDRLGALRVYSARVGGTFVLRGNRDLSFVASILQTVAAANNPYVTYVSVGIGTNGRVSRERR